MKKQKNYLWVVEMWVHAWQPTVGVSLTKERGRSELKDWKQNNPNDKFRLHRYVSER